MSARLIAVYSGSSRPETFGTEVRQTGFRRSTWTGAAPVTTTGIAGDELADSRKLGRENHALYLFSRAHYPFFEKMLGRSLPEASFAENLAYEGPDETELRIGDQLSVGSVKVAITTPRIPCYKLRHFLDAPQGFPSGFSATGRTGFYARVLKTGEIRAGDEIIVTRSDPANATVAELNAALTGFDLAPDLVERVLASPDILPGAAEQIRERVARFRPEIALHPVAGRIVAKSALSPDTAEIRIAPDEAPSSEWVPGQFVTIGLSDASGNVGYRCYSLISGPTSEAMTAPYAVAVRATVGADPDSSVSTRLVENDVTDAKVVIYPPTGEFTPPENAAEVLYIAGGIGITPILAHLRARARQGSAGQARLLYVARSRDAAVFVDELEELAAAGALDLRLWLTGESAGRPDLGQVVGETSQEAEIYVCGPLGMIEEVRTAHAGKGRPNARLHFELFEAPPADGTARTADEAEIRIAGTGAAGRWTPKDGAILDWIERETGLRPPAACRSGLCRTCETTLDAGSVAYPAGIASPAPGRVLLCCARPASDVVEVGLPAGTPRPESAFEEEADA